MSNKGMFKGIAATAVVAMALTSCGGGGTAEDAAATNGDEGELTTLEVGVLPNIDALPIYWGVENGIFEEYGLDVQPSPAQGGAALLPALIEGSLDLTVTNTLTHLIAQQQGLPSELVAGVTFSQGPDGLQDYNDHPVSALAVEENSDIQSVEDLSGATVSANALNGIQEVSVRNAIDTAGGDSSDIDLIELPLSQAQSALESGRVDAVAVNEPFTAPILQAGHRSIAEPFTDYDNSAAQISIVTATEEFAADNVEALDNFRDALTEISTELNENPDEAREGLESYTDIEADLRQSVALPHYDSLVSQASIEEIMELSVRYNLLEDELPIDEVLGEADTIEGN